MFTVPEFVDVGDNGERRNFRMIKQAKKIMDSCCCVWNYQKQIKKVSTKLVNGKTKELPKFKKLEDSYINMGNLLGMPINMKKRSLKYHKEVMVSCLTVSIRQKLNEIRSNYKDKVFYSYCLALNACRTYEDVLEVITEYCQNMVTLLNKELTKIEKEHAPKRTIKKQPR